MYGSFRGNRPWNQLSTADGATWDFSKSEYSGSQECGGAGKKKIVGVPNMFCFKAAGVHLAIGDPAERLYYFLLDPRGQGNPKP